MTTVEPYRASFLGRPLPVIGAPMAGGISTPELTAAVSAAGGIGFVAGGYLTAERLAAEISAVAAMTDEPFGVNLFVPGAREVDPGPIQRYAVELGPEADRLGVKVGEPVYDEDDYTQKLKVLLRAKPRYASFTFGCPSGSTLTALRDAGIAAWVTVTNPQEAEICAAAGVDAIIAQGVDAGGHRGYFSDDGQSSDHETDPLVAKVQSRLRIPLIAAGGIMDHNGVRSALAAGARAVQVGTALMLAPEAATSDAHRDAFGSDAGTRLTRAFSGRTARGIVNRFMQTHDERAPRGYPQVNHMTAPLRAAAKSRGDASVMSLWAGTGYRQARPLPAGELVKQLANGH